MLRVYSLLSECLYLLMFNERSGQNAFTTNPQDRPEEEGRQGAGP